MSEPSDRPSDDDAPRAPAEVAQPAAGADDVDRDEPETAADPGGARDGRAVVVDRGAVEALPAVVVDGPSEAFRHPAADRCPYCLTFIGLNAARRRGVRFCPLCGADWQTIGRTIEAPSGAVIPFGEFDPPLTEEDFEDHPTAEYTRRAEPARSAPPPVVAPPAEPVEAPAPPPSPWLMLATGLFIGLGGTLAVAWWYRQRPPPAPVTIASAPVVAPPVVAPPVEPPPPPVEPAPPVEPPPVEPPPVEPAPTGAAVSSEEVQAALLDRAALLPPSELVDITARVEGDIVFLDGRVGSGDTLGQIVAAVAAVSGVRAVDSRGVRPAARLHAVANGDTLARLARLYYGDANAWPRIYDANREVIDRPDRLVPGMKLKIPRAELP